MKESNTLLATGTPQNKKKILILSRLLDIVILTAVVYCTVSDYHSQT